MRDSLWEINSRTFGTSMFNPALARTDDAGDGKYRRWWFAVGVAADPHAGSVRAPTELRKELNRVSLQN
ncbi:hypothetical protein [Streptomyces phaeochromogenes]